VTVSIRIASSPGEAQIAVVEDNRLVDFSLWRPGAPDGVGDVHRGRVIAHVPGMAGCFVALADAEGFLPDSERPDGGKGPPLTVGTTLAVRITRAAQGDKGPRLAARMDETPGGGPVALLRRGPDPIRRLAARYPEASLLVDDAGVAASLRDLASRVSIAKPAVDGRSAVFDEDVAEAIDALSRPEIELPGGASLSIWPTPALVAIDVDAGGALGRSQAGSGGPRPQHEALNRSALPAIAEQIRLRNLSGGIVVDLAGLSPRKRAGLAPHFASALANDPLHPKFLGFTALGLAEIVRSRIHPPLHELQAGPLAAGIEALRAVVAAFRRDPRSLPAVRAHPGVVAALQADTASLPDLMRRTGRDVKLRSDPSLAATVWMLEKDHG
jgi:Ribonuclease G/E